jgi:hypothetical protein
MRGLMSRCRIELARHIDAGDDMAGEAEPRCHA